MKRKYFPHHGNFGVWGLFGIGHTLIYLFHSNFAETVEKLVCHIDFVLADTTSPVAPFWVG